MLSTAVRHWKEELLTFAESTQVYLYVTADTAAAKLGRPRRDMLLVYEVTIDPPSHASVSKMGRA